MSAASDRVLQQLRGLIGNCGHVLVDNAADRRMYSFYKHARATPEARTGAVRSSYREDTRLLSLIPTAFDGGDIKGTIEGLQSVGAIDEGEAALLRDCLMRDPRVNS